MPRREAWQRGTGASSGTEPNRRRPAMATKPSARSNGLGLGLPRPARGVPAQQAGLRRHQGGGALEPVAALRSRARDRGLRVSIRARPRLALPWRRWGLRKPLPTVRIDRRPCAHASAKPQGQQQSATPAGCRGAQAGPAGNRWPGGSRTRSALPRGPLSQRNRTRGWARPGTAARASRVLDRSVLRFQPWRSHVGAHSRIVRTHRLLSLQRFLRSRWAASQASIRARSSMRCWWCALAPWRSASTSPSRTPHHNPNRGDRVAAARAVREQAALGIPERRFPSGGRSGRLRAGANWSCGLRQARRCRRCDTAGTAEAASTVAARALHRGP